MKINDAQKIVDTQIMRYGGYWRPMSEFLRLIEELGELARAVNIKYGEKRAKSCTDGREIEMELVDVFYTSIAIANSYGIDLTDEIKSQININLNEVTIEEIQNQLQISNNQQLVPLNILVEIVKKVGVLSTLISNSEIKDIGSGISDIIITIINISKMLNIDLSREFESKVEVDEEKIKKVYPSTSSI